MEQLRLRKASALLFGNRYRAELLFALATAPRERGVCLGDLTSELGAPTGAYQAPVRALMDAGLVVRAEPMVGERRRWYLRAGDPAWWESLRVVLERMPDAGAGVGVG